MLMAILHPDTKTIYFVAVLGLSQGPLKVAAYVFCGVKTQIDWLLHF